LESAVRLLGSGPWYHPSLRRSLWLTLSRPHLVCTLPWCCSLVRFHCLPALFFLFRIFTKIKKMLISAINCLFLPIETKGRSLQVGVTKSCVIFGTLLCFGSNSEHNSLTYIGSAPTVGFIPMYWVGFKKGLSRIMLCSLYPLYFASQKNSFFSFRKQQCFTRWIFFLEPSLHRWLFIFPEFSFRPGCILRL
jgi:hypothetical protein